MNVEIAKHQEGIAILCRQYGVRRLDVFGSALREDFDPENSDIDVVVEFDAALTGGGLRQYFDFKSHMESLLKRTVDIVELHALKSPRLRRVIEQNKETIYATPG